MDISFSLITDLLKIIPLQYEGKPFYTKKGLFNGKPKHSNVFFLITHMCEKKIPVWFFDKYVDNEEEKIIWEKYLER